MRYYKETTNEYLGEDITIDELNQSTYVTTLKAYGDYVVDTEEVTHEEVIAEYPNGGKDIEIVVDTPEVGHWHTYDEFNNDMDIDVPESTGHELKYIETFNATYVHTLTDEEKEEASEIRKQTTENMTKQNIVSEANQVSDTLFCHLYEGNTNTVNDDFAKVYASRIVKEEITIDNVPDDIKENVNKKLNGGYMCYNQPGKVLDAYSKSFEINKVWEENDIVKCTITVDDVEYDKEYSVSTITLPSKTADGFYLDDDVEYDKEYSVRTITLPSKTAYGFYLDDNKNYMLYLSGTDIVKLVKLNSGEISCGVLTFMLTKN